MKFTNLHLHTQFSILDGYGTAKQYVAEAKRLKMKALAITDHANVDGAIEFQKECEKNNIQPIIGCEMYVVEDITVTPDKKEKRYHMTLLVKNETGWRNLLKLLTIANTNGFYRRPRIDFNAFKDRCEGLIVMTGCASSIMHMTGSVNFLSNLSDKIGSENVYLELMPHDSGDQIKTNKYLIKMSRLEGFNIVATNDCHYPEAHFSKAQEMLLAIQTKSKWSDSDRWKFNIDGLYLRTREEMKEAFFKQNVLDEDEINIALDATNVIADMCKDFRIQKQAVELPFIVDNETTVLKSIVRNNFRTYSKSLSNTSKIVYRDRIDSELDLIIKLKFTRYFLIVHELINWCKNNDIMVGPGRGSVGGSLVAYMLGITKVDPIKYGLLFERFASSDRLDLPDIDMDFQDDKRDLIRKHLEETYGVNNVAGLSTFGTMQAKAAIRDVARVMDIREIEIKAILADADLSVSDSKLKRIMTSTESGIEFSLKHKFAAEMMIALEGQIRQSGQHAAAICISQDNLSDGKRCNFVKRENRLVVNWDKDYAEHVGLMKLDVLGLSALTVLSEAKKLIKQNHNKDIDFESIDLNDKDALLVLSNGWTAGVFQLGGSAGLTKFCKELKIDKFDTIVHATALWRPGPLQVKMHEEFKLRKVQNKTYTIQEKMKAITADTYGVIIYQEQVMYAMHLLAGMSWTECDKVRKIMGKSKGDAEFAKFKEKFIEGCKSYETSEQVANKIWDEIASFGSYGFNKAHSVEYSMITMWDLWLKCYYPAEFFAASLTYGAEDKKDALIKEARMVGLKVKLPVLGESNAINWKADIEGNLVAPYIEIKGVGEKTAEKLVNHKQKRQQGFFQSKNTEGVNVKEAKVFRMIEQYEAREIDGNELQEYFSFQI